MSSYPALKLAKGADRRLRTGHLWIYANEFRDKLGQTGIAAGSLVQVQTFEGEPLGIAAFNPHNLIAARILERDPSRTLDADWLANKLKHAWALRLQLARASFARLVHGEGDGLPGLVMDRFDRIISAQLNLFYWDQQQDLVRQAVQSAFPEVQTLIYKNDSNARSTEGLPLEVKVSFGMAPDRMEINESGLLFYAPLQDGQKTGWFYDQRDNRDLVFSLLREALPKMRVLDLFCYLGGWGLRALAAGAQQAVFVDASELALRTLTHSAEARGLNSLVTIQNDVFEALKQLKQEQQKFDLIVVDPPAFIKRKKDLEEGALAYKRVFEAALRVAAEHSFIVVTSCSHHYSKELLIDGLARAAARVGAELSLLADLRQAADHPVHPAMPESAYLKGVLARVSKPPATK